MLSGMTRKNYRREMSKTLDRLLHENQEVFYINKFMNSNEIKTGSINVYISQFQNIINVSIDAIRSNGLDYLADLIEEDWQPKSIVSNFKATFQNFLTSIDHPFLEEIYRDESDNKGRIDNAERNSIYSISKRLDISIDEQKEFSEIKIIILYLIASLKFPFYIDKQFGNYLNNFFRVMINYEISIIKKINININRDLPRILSSEIKSKINIKEILHGLKFSEIPVQRAEDEFLDFFYAFTSAQARLLRLQEDSRFLIWLIRTMVEFEYENPNTLPYIKKIAEDVIIHKTLSYDAVKEKSSIALLEVQYLEDFEKTIKDLISCWEL